MSCRHHSFSHREFAALPGSLRGRTARAKGDCSCVRCAAISLWRTSLRRCRYFLHVARRMWQHSDARAHVMGLCCCVLLPFAVSLSPPLSSVWPTVAGRVYLLLDGGDSRPAFYDLEIHSVVAPLVLSVTVVTHLFGGWLSRREGLQYRWWYSAHFFCSHEYFGCRRTYALLVMSGISGGFGAGFRDTALPWTVFGRLEVLSIRPNRIRYEASHPCFVRVVCREILSVAHWEYAPLPPPDRC
jgi:hypothetical protein